MCDKERVGAKGASLRKKLIEMGIKNSNGVVKYSEVARMIGSNAATVSNAFRRGLTVGMFNKICEAYGIKI